MEKGRQQNETWKGSLLGSASDCTTEEKNVCAWGRPPLVPQSFRYAGPGLGHREVMEQCHLQLSGTRNIVPPHMFISSGLLSLLLYASRW